MTQFKFTPGPWNFANTGNTMKENYSQPFAIYQSNTNNLISGCFGDVKGGEPVAKANAKLIAAAPEMAELLKEALEELTFHNWQNSHTGLKIQSILKTITT